MNNFLRTHRFEAIIVLFVLISSLYVAFAPANNLMNWYSTDDAFYYFKTAQNVTEGRGLSFDGIGRSSGFHPLWMLVCIPVFTLARFDLMLPLRVLVIVAGFFNASTGIFLYRMARRTINEASAIITSLLWLLSPSIQGVTSRLGMESTISSFFIVFLLYKVSGYKVEGNLDWKIRIRQLLPIGLVAVLTIFSRLDNIFLVGMAGIWLVFQRTKFNGLLLADLTFFYIAPIYAAFWRLKPGAEYYQYATSVYVLIAISMLVKPLLFELLGVYRSRVDRKPFAMFLRVVVSLTLADVLAFGVLMLLQSTGRIAGFPRMIPAADLIISTLFLLMVHSLDWLTHRRDDDKGKRTTLIDWKQWLPEGVGYGLPIALLMGCYFLFNFFYFGTPSPVSGQIKQWWGSLPNTVYGRPNEVWEGLIGFPENERGPWNPLLSIINTRIEDAAEAAGKTVFDNPYQTQMVFSWTLVGLAAAGLLFVYRKGLGKSVTGLLIPVSFTGCMCQIASYMGTSYVNTRPWYWVQEMVLLVLCGGVLFDAFLAFLARLKMPRNVQQTMVVCLSLFLFYVYAADLISFVPYYVKPGRENLYLAGVVAVEKETPPGAKIGSTGGGVVAYFIKDRTIINLDGLMNSTEYFHLLKEGNANQYMDKIGMEYLHGNKYMITDSDPYMGLFKNRVEFIKDVWGSGLYRYLPGK